MAERAGTGTGSGGGELISALRSVARARIALALAAAALEVGLGALVATNARGATGLAWDGTGVALVILAIGLVFAWSAAVQSSLALLGALLLLRHQDRLLVAPLYAACLLVAGELAQRSLELRGLGRIGRGVVGLRLAAVLVLAALGACTAALGAIAVTVAPARSVGFTALGAMAVLVAFGLIVLISRRRAPARPPTPPAQASRRS